MTTETKYFKCATLEDAQALEAIFYPAFVSEDGENFKFPFQKGTTQYIDPTKYEFAYVADARITALANVNDVVASAIMVQKTRQEAIDAGWLPQPIDLI